MVKYIFEVIFMKKRCSMTILAGSLLLAAVLGMTSCATGAQGGDAALPSPVQPEPSAASSQTPAPAVPLQEAREAYYTALQNLLNRHVLPDGTDCGYDSVSNMAENKFALYDIDQDGTEELIVMYTTTYMAGQVQAVYEYDGAAKELSAELVEFPMLTFYDNGVVKAGWSHNQGLAGEFWPYTLYQYDASSDRYVNVGMVDAWDKNLSQTDAQGNPFPDEIDVSGTGFVYYIMTNGEYETVDPVDASSYNEWFDSYQKGAAEVEIPYQDLTEEQIASIRQD